MCIEDEFANLGPIDYFNAGRTIPEIAEITGHTIDTLLNILEVELEEKIKNLMIQWKTIDEIRIILDLEGDILNKFIKDHMLQVFLRSFKDVRYYKENKEKIDKEICTSFMRLKGIVELSKKFHLGRNKVKKILNEYGFELFQSSTIRKALDAINGESDRPINSEVKEMIDGMMLGDAHIQVMGRTGINETNVKFSKTDLVEAIKNLKELQITDSQNWNKLAEIYNKAMKTIEEFPTARFHLGKALLETPWVYKSADILEKNNYPTHISKNDTITLTVKSTFQMFEQRQRWYPNGTKMVPHRLNMTSNVALFWFIDDGTRSKYQISFATDCFVKKDVQFLGRRLKSEAGIETHIYEHRDKRYPDKKYYSLTISKDENIIKFNSYLEKADPELLKLAKKEFPWKFDPDLKKKDVIK